MLDVDMAGAVFLAVASAYLSCRLLEASASHHPVPCPLFERKYCKFILKRPFTGHFVLICTLIAVAAVTAVMTVIVAVIIIYISTFSFQ